VFYAPYNSEVVECCIASLSSFKSITEEYLAKIEHAGATAALGAILTSIRRFLDKWHGFTTRDLGDPWEPPPFRHRGRENSVREADFFQDLGQLRAEVRILLEFLIEIEPKVVAPSIVEPST
jgi:hypothetical protein